MATNDVKIGLGDATGMLYTAPAGTALPTTPSAAIANTWEKVGDVTDAGITLGLSKSVTNLKNWANQIKRSIQTEHVETIQSPLMDTTEESLKFCMGERNVTVTAASSSHGTIVKVNLSPNDLPAPKAYLWVMKDGDDMIMIGCSTGQVTAVENVTFAPNAGINWVPTITAQDGSMELIMENGDAE